MTDPNNDMRAWGARMLDEESKRTKQLHDSLFNHGKEVETVYTKATVVNPPTVIVHRVMGYLWTSRGKFKGRVWLDYSMLTQRNCPSSHQAATHAFTRAAAYGTLGADAKDIAGHVLFVPTPPWGDPVMVKS